MLEEVGSMWDCCGLHEATQTHIPSIRYSRAMWVQNGNAHTSSDNGSKTSKQTHAVLLFYFHWPVAANKPEFRRIRCGMITVHSDTVQVQGEASVSDSVTFHMALCILNSVFYCSRNRACQINKHVQNTLAILISSHLHLHKHKHKVTNTNTNTNTNTKHETRPGRR